MPKITLIGAGSLVFARQLCSDLLLVPELQGSTLTLMDIGAERLEQTRRIVQELADRRGNPVRLEVTTDRLDALRGADYVITTFQQGGLEAYRLDIEIPQRYGVEQCVGDTLGPGGVFRALRTIPVLLEICAELDAVAPNALLLNYVNPMAANCWALSTTGRPFIGLCHSVQDTSKMLAGWCGVPYEEVSFLSAGINHQAFLLRFQRGGEDLYPVLRRAVQRADLRGLEPVRIDLMEHFGFFVTESSGHASEYVPFFRRSAEEVAALSARFTDGPHSSWYGAGRTGGYLRTCLAGRDHFQRSFAEVLAEAPPTTRSHEYGSHIIEATETGRAVTVYGNVPNHGLIDNLPPGSCVEVPCLVDANGVQPVRVGALPTQLAALNRTNVNVQELTVQAALTGDREAVLHALSLDPLTAAVCTLPELRRLSDEMLSAQAAWLPQFA